MVPAEAALGVFSRPDDTSLRAESGHLDRPGDDERGALSGGDAQG